MNNLIITFDPKVYRKQKLIKYGMYVNVDSPITFMLLKAEREKFLNKLSN